MKAARGRLCFEMRPLTLAARRRRCRKEQTMALACSSDAAVRERIFDEVSDAILIADDERRYVDVNLAACELFDRRREELLGLRVDEVLGGGSGIDVEESWRRFLREGAQRGEIIVERKGRRVVLDYRARAHITPGRHLSVLRDVTDRVLATEHAEKQEREARRLVELRERLLAIVSHDLRNPLSAIMTGTRLLAGGDVTSKLGLISERVLTASHRMVRLVDHLVDFVRVDQGGGLDLVIKPLDLHALAQRATEECALAYPKASLMVHAEGNTAGHWDEDRVLQVLTNLISNAVQHGDGNVDVRVNGAREDTIELTVENGGAPISTDLLPIAFEPFRRLEHGVARQSGLGLGLFITKSIVDAHGGSIDVRSSETGTAFHIELPRRTVADSAPVV